MKGVLPKIMEWLRKKLGLDTLQKDFTEVNSSFKESLMELGNVKAISVLNEKRLMEIEKINAKRNSELGKLEKDIGQVLEILSPKPVPIDFKLVDSLDNKVELFSFHQLMESNADQEKTKVENSNSILSNLVGSIPELTSAGLLANSYRFIFPSGFSGKVMEIGAGQGTAIMQNGGIVAHGSYIVNGLVAAPLAVYAIGSMIIRQHYLNKIHMKLESIEAKVDLLVKLVFADKKAKIDSIIYFYKKCFSEFDNVNKNQNYRNAVLTNLIAKNIEVYELIQFYANSIHLTKNYDRAKTNDFENNLKAFLALQDLFLFGKVLSFIYSNMFNQELMEDLVKEFEDLSSLYSTVLDKNNVSIKNELENNKDNWKDFWLGKKKKKGDNRSEIFQDLLTIDSIKRDVLNNFEEGQKTIEDLMVQLEKSQGFIIEEGELFQVN